VNHSIEVAQLVNGEVVSVRHLSRRRELREIGVAVAIVATAFLAATGLVAMVLLGAHRVVYGPVYGAAWLLTALAMAVRLGRRAAERARRYTVGASIDDDAFAGAEVDLVRRVGTGYELTLAPGMSGTIASGRAPIAVETLVAARTDGSPVRVPLSAEVRAEIALGATTFVVRGAEGAGREPVSKALIKRFARPTFTVVQLMAVGSFLYAVPVGAAIGEADMRSSIPPHATPWETEKALRAQAQNQARSLHRCFDAMPLECQRPGYVGIGLSLSRQGEIRSSWVARSTYGADCPVERCMSEVAASWFFEELPESMQIVLPVQVLRTDKPLVRVPVAAAPALRERAVR
jgi:hypothetical protein